MQRKLVSAAVASALALPMGAQAVEFEASGHVNRAVILVDRDGVDDDLEHVDSNASETRFRFKGGGELDNGLTAGVLLELGRPGDWRNRHAAASLSGDFGKLTLGQTSAASDGMAHADGAFNGGSWLAGVTNWCSYHSLGPACPSNDGGRPDVLRYDTPALGPASIAVSTGNDEYWDAKFTIAGDMGGAGYNFRIGYIGEHDDDTDGKVFATSAAVNFGQGTTIGAAWARDENPNLSTDDTTLEEFDGLTVTEQAELVAQSALLPILLPGLSDVEHSYYYTSIDHSYGDGSVGAYWKKGEYDLTGTTAANIDGALWGIGLGHNIGSGVTAYAGFRHIEGFKVGPATVDDTNLYVAGMRVTFN